MAAEAAAQPPEVDRIVLLSGDADFVPLLEHARSADRSTIVVALPLLAGSRLVEAATRFVSLEDLLKEAHVRHRDAADPCRPSPPPDEVYITKGEHFDSYRLVRNLFLSAERELTIMDPYIDAQIFEMVKLTPIAASVRIITNKVQASDHCILMSKLRNEGRMVRLFKTGDFHDRYLRVDEELWHSGHSLKDLGNRDSTFTKLRTAHAQERAHKREDELVASSTELCV